jgi:hypothetical protein
MDTKTPTRRAIRYRRLLQAYQALPPTTSREEHWTWLMAAHVVGQGALRLHWDSHVRMLALALRSGDGREAAGQLLRLALVPVGHALGRLPQGNIGRATVNAFRPMRPGSAVRARIAWAARDDARG